MTTEQYLEQIRELDAQIQDELEEIHNLRLMIGISGGGNDGERVQSSSDKDKVGALAVKIADMERKVDELVEKRFKITEQIKNMPNSTSRAILTKVYILGKCYKTVSSEINVSYRHFLRLNDKAICEFEQKYLKVVI